MRADEKHSPPPTRRDAFIDSLHGTEFVDPYRWLEVGDSPDTSRWVEEQNRYTRSILDGLPGRDEFRSRLEHLFSIGVIGSPVERNGMLFFLRREGQENQPRLLCRKPGTEIRRSDDVIVDPNLLDPNGTTALDWWYPSWDGQFVAYGLSSGGDEQSTMHIFDCREGRELPETIPFTRFSTVAWNPDSSGFFYTAVVKTLPNPSDISSYYHRAVYFHRLGTDHSHDEEVFPDDDDPETQPAVTIAADGSLLTVWVHKGWDRSWVYIRSVDGQNWTNITDGLSALFQPLLDDGKVYLHTNYDAPRFRVLAVDPDRPSREHWLEVVAERDDATLQNIVRAGNVLALSYLRNAHSYLVVAPTDGSSSAREIALPAMSTVTELSGRAGSDDLYMAIESFVQPPSIFRYSIARDRLELWESPPSEAGLDQLLAPDIETTQVWYPSKDGTRVSMFIVHQEGIQRNGDNPTYLTGYGGFNISRFPAFDRSWNVWVRSGGILAVPNLRGGGEYGEEWHEAGMLDRKRNVFDDFVSAAEYLVQERYTSNDRLAIAGGSNGGLLVGAAMTQRPELFRAVVCSVPLLDMLRYHHFLIAKLWIPEYGSADNPDQFAYLQAYSPYHRVSPDLEYPAVLFMTATSDSRVDPMHARKMAALMQSTVGSRGPILLRVEFQAGHGAGKPVNKLVDQLVDQLSFVASQVGGGQF